MLGVANCISSASDLPFFGSKRELIIVCASSESCEDLEIQTESCQIRLPSLGKVNSISLSLIFLYSSLLKMAKSTSPLTSKSLPFFFPKSLTFTLLTF